MKVIINGKLYDTDSAEEVAKWLSKERITSMKWMRKALMLNQTGDYFFLNEGGALTEYAEFDGKYRRPGVRIEPATEEEAIAFLKEKDVIVIIPIIRSGKVKGEV